MGRRALARPRTRPQPVISPPPLPPTPSRSGGCAARGPAGRHLADGRFRQGGHILTCAPTGAGKGIGAVIPNRLDYPGSAFVLDFKGENYAVTARACREAGQDVFLIDPFGITGAPSPSS
jgi:type IV secretion system protein VirD4